MRNIFDIIIHVEGEWKKREGFLFIRPTESPLQFRRFAVLTMAILKIKQEQLLYQHNLEMM